MNSEQAKVSLPVAVENVAGEIGDALILFLDTCAVLDIVRLGSRRRDAELDAIRCVASLAEGESVRLVSSALLREEWARNIEDVFFEETRWIERLDKEIAGVVECARRTGHPEIERAELAPLGTVTALRSLAEELLARVVAIEHSTELAAKAAFRQGQARPPGRRGKDCLGDCTMVETALSLAQALEPSRKVVFLTSNTRDFCDESKKPDRSIVAEFEPVSISLTFNWLWALNELRKALR